MVSTFACGFECGVDTSSAHFIHAGTASYTTTAPLSGLRSIRCNPTASTGWFVAAGFGTGLLVYRFKAKFTTLPNATTQISGLTVFTNYPGVYFNSSDSKIYAGTGTAALGATGVGVSTGVVYVIDVRINITANPWLVDVSVDGTPCGQRSSAIASDAGPKQVNLGFWVCNVTADVMFDDFKLSITSGDYPIGDGYIHPFVLTSDGTHNVAGANDFERSATGTDILNATTDAYTLIDDVPLKSGTPTEYINMIAPPNATDYVELKFGPAPGISVPVAAPRAVEVICAIAQASTATGNMEIRLNDNGTMGTVYTATGVAGTTACSYKRAHFVDPPSAASVWNVLNDGSDGDFRDLRLRFGSPAALDVVPDQYLASVMIEAEFSAPPTIVANSPADASSDTDTTPTLEFTGTDVDAESVRYNVQIDSVTSFDSSGTPNLTVDSYSESNQDSFFNVFGTVSGGGQAFTPSVSGLLDVAKFYLKKTGSPTGNAVARIYAMSGTYGASGIPTGSALATSDNFNVATLTTSYALITFTFSGANIITLSSGTNYVVTIEYSGGDASNAVGIAYDDSSPTHGGNRCSFGAGVWNPAATSDVCFYVILDAISPLLDKLSGTDSGFLNTVNGGDTDPFNSAEKVSYTVQGGDALALGTYYWRARGIDPSGSNTYGAWTTTRSFTITAAGGGNSGFFQFF